MRRFFAAGCLVVAASAAMAEDVEIVIQKTHPTQQVRIQESEDAVRLILSPAEGVSIRVYRGGQQMQQIELDGQGASASAISRGNANQIQVESGRVRIESGKNRIEVDKGDFFGNDPFFKDN
jgi:hypothetical protein